jgi:exonuclease VII small subunit
VKRAAELIRVCRGRITSARMQVDSVMAELERATDAGAED